MKTGNLRIIKAGLSGFMSAVLVLYMPVMALAETYYINDGDITIEATGTADAPDHTVSQNNTVVNDHDPSPTVSGTSTTNDPSGVHTVTIEAPAGKEAMVTFDNLIINTNPTNETNTGSAAVNVSGAGAVSIELEGTNSLTGGNGHAGIEDNLTGTLTINDADNDGTLTAKSTNSGAGIGGGYGGTGSNITINGGTITAIAGSPNIYYAHNGAGIGGGDGGNGSNITINGGTITAISENCGAGIGGGERQYNNGYIGGNGSNISINGGTVTAIGGPNGGAGIGGGSGGIGSNITITGSAAVSAAGGNSLYSGVGNGAAIGNGGSYNNSIAVDGDMVVDTTGLYTTGSITYYEPGTTAEQITSGTANGDTVHGETQVPDPETDPEQDPDQDPVNPNQVVPGYAVFRIAVPGQAESDQLVSQIAYMQPAVIAVAAVSGDNAETAPAVNGDFATFTAQQNAQINAFLQQVAALIASGRLDLLQSLIKSGFALNLGNYSMLDASTCKLMEQILDVGVPIMVDYKHGGVTYRTTIPTDGKGSFAALSADGVCTIEELMGAFETKTL